MDACKFCGAKDGLVANLGLGSRNHAACVNVSECKARCIQHQNRLRQHPDIEGLYASLYVIQCFEPWDIDARCVEEMHARLKGAYSMSMNHHRITCTPLFTSKWHYVVTRLPHTGIAYALPVGKVPDWHAAPWAACSRMQDKGNYGAGMGRRGWITEQLLAVSAMFAQKRNALVFDLSVGQSDLPSDVKLLVRAMLENVRA